MKNILLFFFSILTISSQAQTIATAYQASFAICDDGTLMSWGDNGDGNLGIPDLVWDTNTPVAVSSLNNVIAVSAGEVHTMALTNVGFVYSWGDDGTGNFSNTPVAISGLSNVVAIDAGSDHSMALKGDGTVWTWGYNYQGMLGDGSTNASPTPIQIPNLDSVIAISGKGRNCLALRSDGSVWAWGRNSYGAIGNGTVQDQYSPIKVDSISDVVTISTSIGSSFALKSDGTLWAWGYNYEGQLGTGPVNEEHYPVQVPTVSDVAYIGSGWYHSIAIESDGSVYAWGFGEWNGCLGTGDYSSHETPVLLDSIGNVTAFDGGRNHSVFLMDDGTIKTCGFSEVGQLGHGDYQNNEVPTAIGNICQIAAGLTEPDAEISMYPNPVQDRLFLDGEFEFSEYEIYNSLGELIMKGTYEMGGLDVSSMNNGVYILRINQGQSRFIKN